MFVGGVRCGKSSLAQAWAEKVASEQLYLATCSSQDDEMLRRIARHRAQRGGSWECVEEGRDPFSALEIFLRKNPSFRGSILLDSLDMLLNNQLESKIAPDLILENMTSLLQGLAALPLPCAVVSSECGQGFVPLNPLARLYGDLLGLINQKSAAICDKVVQVSCGLPLVLKGASFQGEF